MENGDFEMTENSSILEDGRFLRGKITKPSDVVVLMKSSGKYWHHDILGVIESRVFLEFVRYALC